MYKIVNLLILIALTIGFIISCGSDDAAAPTATVSSAVALPAASIGCGSDGTDSCVK